MPDYFSSIAGRYGATRPSYPRALVSRLREVAGGHALAWDAGCGSGQLSVPLADAFERVIASDVSVPQLETARRHERVRYVAARSEASAIRGRVADLCVAAQAAHWFDLDGYFSEVRRVGRSGSLIALVSYGPPRLAGEPGDVLREIHDSLLAPFWPPERRHVESGYRSLPLPFREVDVGPMEMVHVWRLDRFCGYLRTWSAMRELRKRNGESAVDGLLGRVRAAWGDGDAARRVRWPLAVRVGRLE